MIKFDYICKKCWHQWKSNLRIYICPKCGSKDIDLEYEVTGG